MCFNPRARVGRDQKAFSFSSSLFNSFNPRARVGRDPRSRTSAFLLSMFQSTRPRGARHTFLVILLIIWLVSIHAPAWGATHHQIYHRVLFLCFNPRARVGRDLENMKPIFSCFGFNPRARVGRDTLVAAVLASFSEFQSTRPRGARPFCAGHELSASVFQSTRPRGARPDTLPAVRGKGAVSIHAPAWGATQFE